MDLTLGDVARIRDEVGDTPDDTTLYTYAEDVTWWQEVAVRVLRRRFANAAAGGSQTTSFSLDGVLSVGLSKTDLTALSRQIERLESEIAALGGDLPAGVTVDLIRRPDRYR